jgi:hypothetical protein
MLALDGRDDALRQRALAVACFWKVGAHLSTGALHAPVSFAAFSRNYAVGSDDLVDVWVVALAVELDIGQY